MQAQATGSRRFGFNRVAILALAIGALAIAAAALVLNETVELPFTSESQAVTARPVDRLAGYNRIGFLEQNVQLPDGVLPVSAQSIEQIRFLEQNIQLPNGVLPEPAQSVEQIHFLEQNVWEYADAPAAYQGLDDYQPQPEGLDYKFLEENLWDVGPANTSPEPVGIHRDEGINDGLGY